MSAGTMQKQPSEELNASLDFSARLEEDETITLESVTACNLIRGGDCTSQIISSNPAPEVVGKIVTYRVQDGENGDRYGISIKVLTSADELLEEDVYLIVVEE